MPSIWCAISGHGYGHAAQVVPVLNALGALVPGLTVVLRTTVPASFFHDRLTIQWKHSPEQQDVGCIQDGPLKIDIDATWAAHQHFHETWEARLSNEVAAMQAASPSLVIADTPTSPSRPVLVHRYRPLPWQTLPGISYSRSTVTHQAIHTSS